MDEPVGPPSHQGPPQGHPPLGRGPDRTLHAGHGQPLSDSPWPGLKTMKEGSEVDGSTTASEIKEASQNHGIPAATTTTNGSGLLHVGISPPGSAHLRTGTPSPGSGRLHVGTPSPGSGHLHAVGTPPPGHPHELPGHLHGTPSPGPRDMMGATLAALGAELVAAATSTTGELYGHQSLVPWKGNGGSPGGNKGKLDPAAAAAAAAAGRDKIFVCGVCNRCFGYKHVLQNHERTHTGEKPFECKECHKRFTRDHHLKTHMRLHTGEKPYHCTHCERQFVQVANLRRHLRVHTGERPYACELCTSRFSDSNQLKAHMLIHKGEKPFECPKCLGRFRRRHHLMHHKCPKDETNLGKPRRGRRPKAYETLVGGPGLLSVETTGPCQVPVGVPLLSPPPAAHAAPAPHEKSRRKPSHTIRILTPQQRELFLRDTDNIQTQAIDMSLSPTPEGHALALFRPPASGRFVPTMEGVLDLSKSRSDDSEAEPIEEEVEGDLGDEDEDELMDDDDFEDDDDLTEGICSDDGVMHGVSGGGLTMRLSANSWRDESSRESHLSVRSSSSSSAHPLHVLHRSLVGPPLRVPHLDNGGGGGPSGDELSDGAANGNHGGPASHPGRMENHPQVTMS